MKGKALFVVAAMMLLLVLKVSAQVPTKVSFGPRVMAHHTTIQGHKYFLNNKVFADGDLVKDAYGDLTFNYGIFIRRHISKVFYLHSEALYTSYSSRSELDMLGEEAELEGALGYYRILTSTMKRLELPTIVGAKLGAFWLQGGLVSALPLQAEMAYDFDKTITAEDGQSTYTQRIKGEIDEKDWYNSFHLDAQLGFGVTIKKRFILDFRYQTNLTNLRETIKVLDQSLNAEEKMHTIGLGLSVNLGKRQL